MNRKALVIVGLAALIAASTGVAFASNNGGQPKPAVVEPTVAASAPTEALTDDPLDDASVADDPVVTEAPAVEQQPDDSTGGVIDGQVVDPSAPMEELPESQRFLNDTYTIQRVLDAESGEELSLQVVLGKYYNDCTLSTYTDDTLELCLNPSTGVVKKGIYSIYNDTVYVDYGDDRIEKYPIIYSVNAVIDSIIVSDGVYDYYFG